LCAAALSLLQLACCVFDAAARGQCALRTAQTAPFSSLTPPLLDKQQNHTKKNQGSTLGACGDVNRNVMGPAAPYKNRPEYQIAQDLANDLADLLAPQSGAYYDVWLDGEKFVSAYKENPKVTEDRKFNGYGTNFEDSPEPIYGAQVRLRFCFLGG
jgi:sulfite reductase (ferredoxin)